MACCHPHHCKLCGLLSMSEFHTVRTKTLKQIIGQKCHPTRFVYASLHNEESAHVYLCEQCFDWYSRLSKFKKTTRKKCHIPMDNVLVFMTYPRTKNIPDKRNLKRFMQGTLLQRMGPFENEHLSYPLIRELMACVIASKKTTIVDRIFDAWWTLNGNCVIFTNSETSAAMRRLINN